MAYVSRNSGSNNQQRNTPAMSSGDSSKTAILTTGLFAPENSKSKAIGTIKLKEAVTLPAGSYINLYEVDRKGDKSPVFRLQVREASKASK